MIVLLSIGAFLLVDRDNRLMSLDGQRPAIWAETIKKISQKPIVGYGLQGKTIITASMKTQGEHGVVEIIKDFLHPHNLYLTTLFHGGFLALILLIILVTQALFGIKKISPYHFILVFGLIYLLFDGGRLFTSPKEVWFVIWLPLGLLLAIRGVEVDFAV